MSDTARWPKYRAKPGWLATAACYVSTDALRGLSLSSGRSEEEDNLEANLKLAERNFVALAQRRVPYRQQAGGLDADDLFRNAQEVLHPEWVLTDGGSCLDISLLFASVCRDCSLAPFLALTDKHAFVLIDCEPLTNPHAGSLHVSKYLEYDGLREVLRPVESEPRWTVFEPQPGQRNRLAGFLEAANITPVDVTLATDTNASFEDAVKAGNEHLSAVRYLIDLKAAWEIGGEPDGSGPSYGPHPTPPPGLRVRSWPPLKDREQLPQLTDEQERCASELTDATGVILLRGGPGLGKRTVAQMIAQRCEAASSRPTWIFSGAGGQVNDLSSAESYQRGEPPPSGGRRLHEWASETSAVARDALARLRQSRDSWLVVVLDAPTVQTWLPTPKASLGQTLLIVDRRGTNQTSASLVADGRNYEWEERTGAQSHFLRRSDPRTVHGVEVIGDGRPALLAAIEALIEYEGDLLTKALIEHEVELTEAAGAPAARPWGKLIAAIKACEESGTEERIGSVQGDAWRWAFGYWRDLVMRRGWWDNDCHRACLTIAAHGRIGCDRALIGREETVNLLIDAGVITETAGNGRVQLPDFLAHGLLCLTAIEDYPLLANHLHDLIMRGSLGEAIVRNWPRFESEVLEFVDLDLVERSARERRAGESSVAFNRAIAELFDAEQVANRDFDAFRSSLARLDRNALSGCDAWVRAWWHYHRARSKLAQASSKSGVFASGVQTGPGSHAYRSGLHAEDAVENARSLIETTDQDRASDHALPTFLDDLEHSVPWVEWMWKRLCLLLTDTPTYTLVPAGGPDETTALFLQSMKSHTLLVNPGLLPAFGLVMEALLGALEPAIAGRSSGIQLPGDEEDLWGSADMELEVAELRIFAARLGLRDQGLVRDCGGPASTFEEIEEATSKVLMDGFLSRVHQMTDGAMEDSVHPWERLLTRAGESALAVRRSIETRNPTERFLVVRCDLVAARAESIKALHGLGRYSQRATRQVLADRGRRQMADVLAHSSGLLPEWIETAAATMADFEAAWQKRDD